MISESKASDCEGEARPFFDYLENCLRNKSEMVIFEAVRYLIQMSHVCLIIDYQRCIGMSAYATVP